MSEEKFSEVGVKAEEVVNTVIGRMAMPFNVKFQFIANNKQKGLIKIAKVGDVYQYLTHIDVLVIINDIYADVLDDEALEILVTQELDRLQFDANSGKIKIGKPELSTSVGVIKKYGIEAVARANKLVDTIDEQKDDMEGMQQTVNNLKVDGMLKDDGVDFLS